MPASPNTQGKLLSGLAFAVKDNIDVKGWTTGCGNPEWARRQKVSDRNAVAVTRLLEEEAVFRGKTITDEFAWSAAGDNPHYGAPINPAAPQRLVGGSSCGSASVVAQGFADFALGTDTGGSVRIPAAFTGLFGMRPTHGAIPMEGVMPLAPSMDTVGFMARDARLLRAIGRTLLPVRPAWAYSRLLIAEDAFGKISVRHREALEPQVAFLARNAARTEQLPLFPGAQGMRDAAAVFRVYQAAEIRDCLVPMLRGMDPFLGASLGKRIAYARSITKGEAQAARKHIEALAIRLLHHVGPDTVVVLPTTHDVAPLRTSAEASLIEHRQSLIELNCAASIAGMPQITLPAARLDHAPFGLSIMGPPGSDLTLLNLACSLQEADTERLFAKMEGYVTSDPEHTPGHAGTHAGFPYGWI
ncbi:amidase [Pollutimonas sp. M17]|uniref:amidase n=1 Tax=Pollutimonas sp. M17 TaxID=2962065 RepID=UPI0021F3D7EE|nr:amidase [Pollutimonas sp. M17]UYO93312.1 amidase [Pollutimonas sp. M17]